MKHIIIFLFGVIVSLTTLSSCVTSAYAYEPETTIDYNVIITNGQIVYYNGAISYYVYNGIYYYPYMYNGYRCLHPFRTIQPRGYCYVPPHHHRPVYIHRPIEHRQHYIVQRNQHKPNVVHHRNHTTQHQHNSAIPNRNSHQQNYNRNHSGKTHR